MHFFIKIFDKSLSILEIRFGGNLAKSTKSRLKI
jgi:hypothetical protein